MTTENQAPEGGESLAVAARELLDALATMNTGTLPEHQMAPGWQNGAGEEIGTRICAAQAALRAALAAQPQAPVALAQEQWPPTPSAYQGDQYIGYSRTDLLKYAQEVLAVHGITQTKEPTNDR